MKAQKNKIELHRETLRSLDGNELNRVAGGASNINTYCGPACISIGTYGCSCRNSC